MKPQSTAFRFSRWHCATGLLLTALASFANAQTFKLDDSTSPRSRVTPKSAVDETGRPLNNALEPTRAILRFGEVVYRLDMRAHLGQNARLFFVRSPEAGPPNGSKINWATRDGAQKGALMSGERALVWSGKVTEPWMNWSLLLELDLDLQRLTPSLRASGANPSTYFELER